MYAIKQAGALVCPVDGQIDIQYLRLRLRHLKDTTDQSECATCELKLLYSSITVSHLIQSYPTVVVLRNLVI